MAARDELELRRMLKEIRRKAHVTENDILNLPAIRIFKIDVRFRLT